MITEQQLNEWEELAKAATPGEWKAVSYPSFDSGLVYTSVQPVTVDEDAMKPMAMMNGEYHVCRMSHTAAEWRFRYHRANAAFIAASRTAVPALVERVRELEAALEHLHRTAAIVSDKGATLGSHWTGLTTALLRAKSTLGRQS